MKKKALYCRCPHCGEEHRFEKTDLPAGFISPDDLNKYKETVLAVECPKCNQSDVFTLEDVKKALVKWEWFWKE